MAVRDRVRVAAPAFIAICAVSIGVAASLVPWWVTIGALLLLGVAVLGWLSLRGLLMFYAFVAVNLGVQELPVDVGFAVTPDVIVTSIVIAAFAAYFVMRRQSHLPTYVVPFAFFLLVSLATLPTSPAPFQGFKAWFRFLSYPLIALTAAEVVSTREGVWDLVRVLLLSSIVPLTVGIIQLLTQSGEIVYVPGLETIVRLKGTTGGSYTYSFYLCVITLLSMTLLFERSHLGLSTRTSIALAALAALSTASVILTFIRGAWLALIAGWLVLGAFAYRRLLIAAPVVVALMWFFVEPVRARMLTILMPSDTSVERLILWQYSISLFLERPVLGHGLYAFEWGLTDRVRSVLPIVIEGTSPHNEPLQFLVDSGVVGAAAFYASVLLAARQGWMLLRTSKEPLFAAIGLSLIAFTAALLVGGLTQNPLSSQPAVSIYFWLLVGLSTAALRLHFRALPQAT